MNQPFPISMTSLHVRQSRARGVLAPIFAAMMLTSCMGNGLESLPGPLNYKVGPKSTDARELVSANRAATRDKISSSEGPTTPLGKTVATPLSSTTPPKLTGENISINFEGIRLPAFINTVFGELLGVSFEIDSVVQQREQLVALRITEPLPPSEFYEVVRQVLRNYGLSVVYQNEIYRIVDTASTLQDLPKIVRSRALPTVPNEMRPIFYYAPLSAIPASLMQSFLNQSLKDRLQYQSLPLANGLLLLGKAEDIEAAKETIAVLDQPALAGFKSLRISPAFWSAERLGSQLVEVLAAEGYSVAIGGVSNSAIKVVPVRALNMIVVFCPDDTVMAHVLKWATELDQPGQTVETKAVFYHPVYNTKAEDIAEVIGELLGEGVGSLTGPRASSLATAPMTTAAGGAGAQTGTSNQDQRSGGVAKKVIVDKSRNAIIFQGAAEEYAQFRSLADQMDRAPLEVMIEATVAEVTLKQGETLGLVLNYDDGVAAATARSVIKSDAGLLVNLIRDAGQLTGSLKALSDKNLVNILSSPRVVASSGKPAAIQIGTQVPIITTQQTSPTGTVGGTSALLQDIQYRNTGVQLAISPTINSNRRVELEIQQEVSEAQVNNVSDVQSPLILTRSISTTLSLDDGQTVLLGGLISENFSKTETGIPLLQDIPVLGNLFKSTGKGRNRTELIVLLTPYIIENAETANALRDAFRDQLTSLPTINSVQPAPATTPASSTP
jgi:general secretion pathway protein D